jgi:hypothetical protein
VRAATDIARSRRASGEPREGHAPGGACATWRRGWPHGSGARHSSSPTAGCAGACARRRARTLPEPILASAKKARDIGESWLWKTHKGRARWYDYPFSPDGQPSVSISGLVLYVLHQLHHHDPHSLASLDRDWAAMLPFPPPHGKLYETSGDIVMVDTKGHRQQDPTRHMVLPWVLIASADAFPNLSEKDRSQVIYWIDQLFAGQEIDTGWATSKPWRSAELLFALTYLKKP